MPINRQTKFMMLTSMLIAIFILLFVSADSGSDNFIHWRDTLVVDTGPAIRGEWQQNESRFIFVDDINATYFSGNGLAVTWVDQAQKDIFFQHYSKDGEPRLSQPVNVSRTPEVFSWLPKVVTSPDSPGTVYILWQEIIFSGGSHGGDILFSRSEDYGETFSKPLNLSQSIGGAGKGRIYEEFWENGSLDLVTNGDGKLYAAWTEHNGSLWISRSRNGGQSFSPKRQIAQGHGPARAPSLALGKGDTVYVAWSVGENTKGDIHLAKSTDGGKQFSRPHPILKSKGYSDVPKITVDDSNKLHLVYSEAAAGPFSRFQINYTYSSDGGQTFSAPREISRPLPEGVASARYPDLGLDAQENIIVVWELFPNPKERPRGLGMAVSKNGGKSFAPARRVPKSRDPRGGVNGSQQGHLMGKLAVNDDGRFVIANSSFEAGDHSRVWLIRGSLTESESK